MKCLVSGREEGLSNSGQDNREAMGEKGEGEKGEGERVREGEKESE